MMTTEKYRMTVGDPWPKLGSSSWPASAAAGARSAIAASAGGWTYWEYRSRVSGVPSTSEVYAVRQGNTIGPVFSSPSYRPTRWKDPCPHWQRNGGTAKWR